MKKPILVVGSRGKTGKRIVQRLHSAGYQVRAGSRSAEPPFDWEKPETWEPLLQGVSAAYVSYYPDLAFPGALEAIAHFCALAKRNHLGRLVLLSGRGEHQALQSEQVVRQSGIEFTLLRCSWFFQNFSEGVLLSGVKSGSIALPASDVKEPFIDVDDIADAAFAALTQEGHSNKLYELTGDELLTFAEAAEHISNSLGRSVSYLPINLDDFRAGMTQIVGPAMAAMYTELCREVFDGRNSVVASGVLDATARRPKKFSDYCRAMAASGVWDAEQ